MPVAVITGASTGIGCATALELAGRGFHVVATMRAPGRADGLRALAAQRGLPIELAALDVSRDDAVAWAFAAIHDRHGAIDVLVNNAGIAAIGAVEDLAPAAWRDVFEVNVLGAVRCCQAVLPAMRRARSGHIVNVGSAAGRIALAAQAAYAASKFALEGLSEALAHEVAEFGIRVSIIEPGVTVTPMLAKHGRPPAGSAYRRSYGRLAALYRALLRQASRPERVARVIADVAAGASAGRLHWPVGADAEALIAGRAAMDDADWLALGDPDPSAHRRFFAAHFGIAIEPDPADAPTSMIPGGAP